MASTTDRLPADAPARSAGPDLVLADRHILAFLDLLHNRGLAPPSASLHNAPHETQARIHALAYIAQNLFGLGLRYRYGLYKNRAYAPRLVTDCHLISREPDSGGSALAGWGRLEDFVEFAAGHSSEWLDIASTLMLVRSAYGLPDRHIVKYVCSLRPDVAPECVRGVHGVLSGLGRA